MMQSLMKFLATGLGLGYVPKMPGTAGSALGLVLVWALAGLNVGEYLLFTVVFSLFSIWIADQADKHFSVKDAPQIVIDEVAGIVVTFVAIPLTPLTVILGFILFRFFDIVKIPPIRQSQRLPGGWGVVVDDLLAGVAANIVMQIVLTVWYMVAT
jgi:phosphatidylglycerophosphatase A